MEQRDVKVQQNDYRQRFQNPYTQNMPISSNRKRISLYLILIERYKEKTTTEKN